MDKFEQMSEAWQKMSPEEQIAGLELYKEKCICPTCPTYNDCAKNAKERLFCAIGKSFMCISEAKSCMCPTCPVTPEYGMKYQKFCVRGSEMAQRYEKTIWGASLNR